MSRLVWDAEGQRKYENGVDRVVLYTSGHLDVFGYSNDTTITTSQYEHNYNRTTIDAGTYHYRHDFTFPGSGLKNNNSIMFKYGSDVLDSHALYKLSDMTNESAIRNVFNVPSAAVVEDIHLAAYSNRVAIRFDTKTSNYFIPSTASFTMFYNSIPDAIDDGAYSSDSGPYFGHVWNGVTSATESPEGADKTDHWADNIKYASQRGAETFGGTIEAYTFPDQFYYCDGFEIKAVARPNHSVITYDNKLKDDVLIVGQQVREPFCLSFRTNLYTETNSGYLIHLWYNCIASPSERAYETINDSPDALTFSWEVDSTPIAAEGYSPVSSIIIDSTKVNADKLAVLESILYGDNGDAVIPSPQWIIDYFTPSDEEEESSGGD